MNLNFYDFQNLQFEFADGTLTDVSLTEQYERFRWDGRFAYESFLSLVFGHRSLKEIRHILPDTWANRDAAVLLDILFPKKQSMIFTVS